MTKLVVREIEYETILNQESSIASIEFLWLFIELINNEAFQEAKVKRVPLRSIFEKLIASAQENINIYFGDLLSWLCLKDEGSPSREFIRLLHVVIPTLPENEDPVFLTEVAFAYITALAQEGVRIQEVQDSKGAKVGESQSEKKSRKKKGFGEKLPEVSTLEDLTGREVSPDEIAAVKHTEGKPLEEAIAAPLISIPNEKLARLRPDLLTLEEQDLQAALAEQQANRLTVVSAPIPPDADELEDLI